MIPRELRELPQWVCWKYVADPRRAKPRKVPFNVRDGSRAKPNAPATWATFDEALAVCPRYEGLGFMFAAGGEYVGVDLDGMTLDNSPRARAVVSALDSYTEVSPSGTGLHIICKHRGKLQSTRDSDIEVYSWGRFFAMTGNRVGARKNIRDATKVLDSLVRSIRDTREEAQWELGERIGSPITDGGVLRLIDSVTEPRLLNILRGQWDSYYASESEADMAAATGLAYWTGGDYEQSLRLLQKSALWDDKWEREDYQHATLGKAVARVQRSGNVPHVYMPAPGFEPIPRDPLDEEISSLLKYRQDATRAIEEPLEEVTFLVPDLLPTGDWAEYAVLAGAGGMSKTTLAMQIAMGLATGTNIALQWDVPAPRPVVYLMGEDSERVVKRRMHLIGRNMTQAQRALLDRNFYMMNVQRILHELQLVTLDPPNTLVPNIRAVNRLLEFLATVDPALIIIDTLSRFAGLAEESNTNGSVFSQLMLHISNSLDKALVMVVHHTRKGRDGSMANDAVRGASSLVNNSRLTLMLSPAEVTEGKKKTYPMDMFELAISKFTVGPRRSFLMRRDANGLPVAHVDFKPIESIEEDDDE